MFYFYTSARTTHRPLDSRVRRRLPLPRSRSRVAGADIALPPPSPPQARASSTAVGCATPSRRSTRPTQARWRCHPPASRHLAFAAAPRRSSSTRATPTPSATARPPSTASSLAARTLWATAAPPSSPLPPLLSPTTAPLPRRRRRTWQLRRPRLSRRPRRPRQPRRPRRPLRQRGQCFSSKWSRSCRRSGARARRPRRSASARASRSTRRSARRSAGDALRSRGGAGGMREKLRRAPVRLAKTSAPTRRRLRERLLSLREATVLRVSSAERQKIGSERESTFSREIWQMRPDIAYSPLP